ncbi:hypothetical protein IAT40_000228 [Kwoniella sp. CBS 6097]
MGLLEIAQTVYPKISIVSIPLLFIALLPHLVPTTASGISPHHKLSAPSISFTFWTIARAGTTVLDHFLLSKGIADEAGMGVSAGGMGMLCGVDAIVVAALITGMAGHLPVIALHRYQTLPSPKKPIPAPPNAARTTLVLILIYTYALLPCIPTLAGAVASKGFDMTTESGEGFAQWWGFYCIERADWFKIVRPISILVPIVATLPLSILIFSSLYSTSGHPSPHIQPSPRNWTQAILLMAFSLVAIAYIVLEQIIGWSADWWPRSLEALAGPLLFVCLATDPRVWNTYIYWIRFERPPTPLLPPSSSPMDSSLLASPSSKSELDPEKPPSPNRASSFLAPPSTALKRGVHFPPTPQRNTIIPYHPSMMSNLSNGTSVITEQMEELFPPLRKSEDNRKQNPLELERSLHPHPHSIDDDHSPPTNLSTQTDQHSSLLYTQDTSAGIVMPPSTSFAPTTTSQQGSDDGRRYTSSTNSSPFAYEAFATMCSSNGPLTSTNSMISAPFPYATSTVYTDRTPLPTALPVTDPNGSRDTYDSTRTTGVGPLRADRRSVVPTVRVIDEDTALDTGRDPVQRRDSRARLPFESNTIEKPRLGEYSGASVGGDRRGSEAVNYPRPRMRASTFDGLTNDGSIQDRNRSQPQDNLPQARGGRPLTEVSSIYSQPSLLDGHTNSNMNNPPISRSASRRSIVSHAPSSTFSISNYSYPNPTNHPVQQSSRGSISSSIYQPRAQRGPQSQSQSQLQPQRPSLLEHMRTDSTLSGPSLYDDSNHPLESLAEAEEEEAGRIVFGSASGPGPGPGPGYGSNDYDYMEEIEGDPPPPGDDGPVPMTWQQRGHGRR